jgi:glycosyltransferase involved in cell wall biosynthesis
VSVITPFHNTAQYLAQCIESVLGQTYWHFEYVLVDNCSTDGAGDIAESYAQRDSRIRVVHRPNLLSQVQNYNAALAEVSTDSKYCKIVQADDYIFPDCLKLMVQAFEQSDSIGLVSAYDLKANVVRGSGFPFRKLPWPGKEVIQHYFRHGDFVFGSPTSLMYRSALVRKGKPFFEEFRLHEDTEKCFEILREWDFGFVYQVLSFIRTENNSITSAVRGFQPDSLDRYIVVQRFASAFLKESEAACVKREARLGYYEMLAHAAIQSQPNTFWQYHRDGLKTIGEVIDRSYLGRLIAKDILRLILNPGMAVASLIRRRKRRATKKRDADSEASLQTVSTRRHPS